MTQDTQLLLREDDSGITTLTLNRPNQFNALSGELLAALTQTLDAIKVDESVRVVILKASGRAFCVGHDLKEMRANSNREFIKDLFTRCGAMMQRIQALPQPVIASVHATATAAGCQLAAACDLAVASDQARFAVSGITLGLFCSTPAVALSRNVGRKAAMEMLMTGEFVDAQTAKEHGLVNKVVVADELDAAVLDMAQKIAAKPPGAVALGKELFYAQLGKPLDEAYEMASEAITCNMLMDDTLEGVDAFIEKRKPNWPQTAS